MSYQYDSSSISDFVVYDYLNDLWDNQQHAIDNLVTCGFTPEAAKGLVIESENKGVINYKSQL